MSETNTPPQQVLVYPQYPNQEENEINLFDLWQALVKQKKTIFATTAIVTLFAILYALLATPVYRAETVFLPPAKNDIQELTIKNVSEIKTGEVYAIFRENLGSIAIRKQIFEQMKLADQFQPDRDETTNVDEIFNKFNKNIKLTIPNPKKGEFVLPTTKLTLEGKEPVLIAEIVNSLAKQADKEVKKELISDIEAKVDERKKQLKLEINLLLDKTKKQRLDEIERLETADALERKKVEDKIKTLRTLAKKQRLDEVDRLETADALERKKVEDKINILRVLAKKQRIDEIERLETANLLERRKLVDKINTLKGSAKGKRLDRIKKLTEASEIAHSMGIKDPIDYKLKKISKSATTKSQIMTDISANAPQLYTRGYEALEAEIVSLKKRLDDTPFIKELRNLEDKLKLLRYNRKAEQLKKRTNDDPFIKGLRDLEDKLTQLEYNRKAEQLKQRTNDDPFIKELRGLQEKLTLLDSNRKAEQLKNRNNDAPFIKELREKENTLAYLETINIEPESIKTAYLDQAAFPSNKKIKPKRKLMVILGMILGLILGILIAFIRNIQGTQRVVDES